jgi:hypothetical protein
MHTVERCPKRELYPIYRAWERVLLRTIIVVIVIQGGEGVLALVTAQRILGLRTKNNSILDLKLLSSLLYPIPIEFESARPFTVSVFTPGTEGYSVFALCHCNIYLVVEPQRFLFSSL